MRRRITFLQRPNSAFDPESQTTLTSAGSSLLQLRSLDAAREERITFQLELDEERLPIELSRSLQECEESQTIHLRWATQRAYLASGPFSSRVAPGLHAFVTVAKGREDRAQLRKTDRICDILGLFYKAPGEEDEGTLKCITVEESFTVPPDNDERIPSYQFYSHLSSLDGAMPRLLRPLLCDDTQNESLDDTSCRRRLESIDSLDIDYDSDLRALTVSAYWSTAPKGGWTEDIRSNEGMRVKETVEVGLLETQKSTTGPEEIKLGGFLAVVGSDDTLKPTLFSIPSRHHQAVVSESDNDLTPSTYAISFAPPTGLHPTMTISIPRKTLQPPPSPPHATCSLHTYLTLPSGIFADKYQLSTTDPLFLDSHNLVGLRAVSGETDLEAPDWFINRWGSTWLLELATPPPSPSSASDSIHGDDGKLNDDAEKTQKDWTITIPLHLRYLLPSESGNRTVGVPWPAVFWACQPEHETGLGKNPFDRRHLGWDGLFKPNTLFHHLTPTHRTHPTPLPSDDASGLLVEELEVPVLKLSRSTEPQGLFSSSSIEFGTVLVVGLGFFWVLWKLGLVLRKTGFRPMIESEDARYGDLQEEEEEKKKN